ncbi:hypothetical protein AZ022_004010, partial [Klebsiella pneumoniae]
RSRSARPAVGRSRTGRACAPGRFP